MPMSQSPSCFAAGVALRLSHPNRAAPFRMPARSRVGRRQSGQRVLLGFVPDAQLDRVHAEFNRELVHRAFEPERAHRFPGSAHASEGVGDHVHPHRLNV